MLSDEIFHKIVRYALKSPSKYNSQPWLFANKGNEILIKPDFNRSLPISDPDHRELYLSLGSVAETAIIAAQFYGYRPTLYIDNIDKASSVKLLLQKDQTCATPELFVYISGRQTNPTSFNDTPIPFNILKVLKESVTDSNVNLRYLVNWKEIEMLKPLIAEAIRNQWNNPDFKTEIMAWMRFSQKEAMQKGDGHYASYYGIPLIGRLLGVFIMKYVVGANHENKQLQRQLNSSSAIAMFSTSDDTVENWIKTGMAFQRFVLTATKLNISYSFLNPPCQVAKTREILSRTLFAENEIPQLIVRLGSSKKLTSSPFRRRLYSVICPD